MNARQHGTLFAAGGALVLVGVLLVWLLSSPPPLDAWVGHEVDVEFGKNVSVLWLGRTEYHGLILQAVADGRAIFHDPRGEFVAANGERLDGVDRFGYGEKVMSERPVLLSPTTFSVRIEDLAVLRAEDRVVWSLEENG